MLENEEAEAGKEDCALWEYGQEDSLACLSSDNDDELARGTYENKRAGRRIKGGCTEAEKRDSEEQQTVDIDNGMGSPTECKCPNSNFRCCARL